MIIDFHIHLFSPSVSEDRNIYLADGQFNCIYNSAKAKIIDRVQAAAALNEAGIDRAVAMGFPWDREDFCSEQNAYLRSACELSKGKIVSFASVPLCSANSVESWVRDIKHQGFSGIGEVAFYRDGLTPGNLDYLRKLMDAVQKHSLPLCLHLNEPVGHKYPGKYTPEFHYIYSVLADFPDVTVILSHWGGGLIFYELMAEVSSTLKNCYYDTAASPLLYSETVYSISPQIVSPKKILFGSDYPLVNYSRYFDSIHRTVMNKESIDYIMGLNAVDLLKIR
jgi:hypothetical protein